MPPPFSHNVLHRAPGLLLLMLAAAWAPLPTAGQDFDRSRMYLALPPLDTTGAGDGATTAVATGPISALSSDSGATPGEGAMVTTRPITTIATGGGAEAPPTTAPTAGWDLGYAVAPETATAPRPTGAPSADADVMLGDRPLMETVQFHRDLIAWDPDLAVLAPWRPLQTQLFTDPPSMIHYAFAIELSSAETRQELTTRAGPVDEAIHRIIQTIPPEDLRTLAGKMRMKRRIVRAINAHLTQGAAREIYFTEFFIQ